MHKAQISEYTYIEIKDASSDSFESKEIVPGALISLTPKQTSNDLDTASAGDTGKIYVLNLPIAVLGKNSIVFVDPATNETSFEGLKTKLSESYGSKSIKDLVELSGFDFSGHSLQFPTLESMSGPKLTERFQEFQKSVKDQIDNVFKK